jgi:hypothetical protein
VTEYAKREGAFQPGETIYRAGEVALVAERPDGVRLELPWADVERVRLRPAPTRFKPGRRLLTLAGPAAILSIDNMHYDRPGRFEARDKEFAAFAAEAAGRTAAAVPEARFYLGAPGLSYAVQLMLALGGLALAGVAILAFAPAFGGWPLVIVLKLIVLAAFLPLLIRWAVQARPRRASVAALQEMLNR